jgi:hypothetical protein
MNGVGTPEIASFVRCWPVPLCADWPLGLVCFFVAGLVLLVGVVDLVVVGGASC